MARHRVARPGGSRLRRRPASRQLIRRGHPRVAAPRLDLYRGRFLADIAISEEAWTDWLAGERQRLEGLALDAMMRLGEQELAAATGPSPPSRPASAR